MKGITWSSAALRLNDFATDRPKVDAGLKADTLESSRAEARKADMLIDDEVCP